MTTFVDFTPPPSAPFQFQATLDANIYNVIVTWNVFAQRWYINVYGLDGTLVVCKALIGSGSGLSIQSAQWFSGGALLTLLTPHNYPLGGTVRLNVVGCAPDGYNGIFDCLACAPSQLSYPLPVYPGAATLFGSVNFDIDLVAGYFKTSSLVYREANKQFEISEPTDGTGNIGRDFVFDPKAAP